MAGLGHARRKAVVRTISTHSVQWFIDIMRARARAPMVIQPIAMVASLF
jgi:hypothetical protein